jgi:hypothetical protein
MAGIDREDRQTHHPQRVGFEQQDVNIRAVTRFGIVLFLGLIAVLFGLWGLFTYFQSEIGKIGPQSRSLLDIDARKLPPEPRLQPSEYIDLRQMRAAEDQILNGYALLEPDHGIVRIPINRAMDLLAQRGLPVHPAAPRPPNPLTAAPTESGLGPAVQQVGGPLAPVIHIPPVQPLEIRGDGNFGDGRQAGGPPTPAPDSPALESPARAPAPSPAMQGQKK